MFLVSSCGGRSVSVGKSKLSHKIKPSILSKTRLPALYRDNCTKEIETVFVAQTVNLPASVKISIKDGEL